MDGSDKQIGLRIKELERLYGIKNGGNRGNQYVEAERNNFVLAKTQEDLAAQLDIDVRTLRNYKLLTGSELFGSSKISGDKMAPECYSSGAFLWCLLREGDLSDYATTWGRI